jgi:hypothetical protein
MGTRAVVWAISLERSGDPCVVPTYQSRSITGAYDISLR